MLDPSLLIIRGIIGIIAGIVAFAWPGLTIALLVGIFAAYAFIDGVTNVVLGSSRSSRYGRSWALVVQGIAGIAFGVMTVMWPGVTALVLIWFIAAWAVVTGIFEVAGAIRLRRVISGDWLLVLSGVMSLLFGILVFAFPAAGAVGIAWILGTYAAATGIILVILGVRLRGAAVASP
jgi:uncharacterized membrane protein HdeD (DUF308 family)